MGFVSNPESALVPMPQQAPTLTPTTSVPTMTSNGGGGQSVSAGYTVAPRPRRASEKLADDNLIDLDGLGQSLDK